VADLPRQPQKHPSPFQQPAIHGLFAFSVGNFLYGISQVALPKEASSHEKIEAMALVKDLIEASYAGSRA
jgi:hypothetical protein